MKLSIILFSIFTLLQIADGILTWKLLHRIDRQESNPIAAWLMRQMGVTPALIVFKGGIVLIVAAALWFAPSIYLTYGMVVVCLFYCWVVWNNYKLL